MMLVEDGDPEHAIGVLDFNGEERTGKLSLMAGYSNRDGALGSIGVTQRNFDFTDWPKDWKSLVSGQSFRGAGQSFDATVSVGQYARRYNIGFENPWIFGKPISFGINAFHSDEEWDDFSERRTGFGISFGKRLFGIPQLRGTVGYRVERVGIHDFSSGIPATSPWREEGGYHWINRYYANIKYDSRNDFYIPTKGNMLSATGEVAGRIAGGNRDFWRAFLEAQTFLPLYEDRYARPYVLSLRGEAGWVDAYGSDKSAPVYEKMYAGGIGSVRGFEQRTISPKDMLSPSYDPIGGEGRMTASAELFVPVYRDMLRASAFYDVGTVWKDVGDGPSDWRRSFGVGLHIKVPITPMPIMLYYSWTNGRQPHDEEERFQFSFGMLF
jgi:outer membrane protein insertion porin family